MENIQFTIEHNNTHYKVFIMQYSYDEIIVNINYAFFKGHKKDIIIPVKKCAGFAWKLNKKSISCDSGKAADIIKLFAEWNAYAKRTVTELCF